MRRNLLAKGWRVKTPVVAAHPHGACLAYVSSNQEHQSTTRLLEEVGSVHAGSAPAVQPPCKQPTRRGRSPPTAARVWATMLFVLMLPAPRRNGLPSVIRVWVDALRALNR